MSELADKGCIDIFYQDEVIDCYTFVFNEQDPRTLFYTMLATCHTGRTFSQWTEGYYDPEGPNEHLGERTPAEQIGEVLVRHVLGRLEEW